jgi:recombination protein RecT
MGTEMVKYQENAVIGSRSALKELVLSDGFKAAVAAVAPRHLDPDRLTRMVLSAESRNPRILECTMGSILKSVIEASTLGLDCSGLLGRGYLVPYKNGHLSQRAGRDVYEAQFQAGYLGLVDLARNTKEVLDVRAVPVYEGDEFDYGEGLKPFLTHKPLRGDPRKAPNKHALIYCYAVADFRDGYQKHKVMTVGEIEEHRNRSKGKDSTFWRDNYEAMALKTVVRQLCKWIPQSPELARALASEEAVELNVGIGETEAVPVSHQLDSPAARKLRGEEPEPPPAQMERQPATQDDTPKRRGRRTNAEIEAARAAEEAAKVREANTPPQPDPGANTGPASGKPAATATNPWVPFQIDDVVQGVEDKGDTLWVLLGRTGRVEVTSPEAFNLAGDSKGRACRIVGRKHKATARVLVESVTDLADLDEGGSNSDDGEIPFDQDGGNA